MKNIACLLVTLLTLSYPIQSRAEAAPSAPCANQAESAAQAFAGGQGISRSDLVPGSGQPNGSFIDSVVITYMSGSHVVVFVDMKPLPGGTSCEGSNARY